MRYMDHKGENAFHSQQAVVRTAAGGGAIPAPDFPSHSLLSPNTRVEGLFEGCLEGSPGPQDEQIIEIEETSPAWWVVVAAD